MCFMNRSHKSIDQDQFGLVLAFPVPTLEKEDQQDPSRIPVLERMAQLLVESKAAKNSRDVSGLSC